jgi:hypothetical protein
VRMQMELASRGRHLCIERAPAQKPRRSALAGSYQKVASSNVARGAHVENLESTTAGPQIPKN